MPYKCDTDTQVCFYEQEFYCLSNFSAFRLMWRGQDFDTVEHAYHWEKFHRPEAFYDPDETPRRWTVQRQIQASRSAHAAFKLAQAQAALVRPDWPAIKVEVMRSLLRAKLQQHEYVRRKLLETGDRLLIEDSWRDSEWGWGPNKDGLNMLGKVWMELREQLRKEKMLCLPAPAVTPVSLRGITG